MSSITSVLVRGCESIETIKDELDAFLGHSMERESGVTWTLYRADALGLSISLFDADFEDNLGIDFERFPYAVSIYPWKALAKNSYYNRWLEIAPLLIASVFSMAGMECLVVQDVQRVIAGFPPGGTGQ